MLQATVISTFFPFVPNDSLTNQNPPAFAAGQESERNAWTLSGGHHQCRGQGPPGDGGGKTSAQGCRQLVGWQHTVERVEQLQEVQHTPAWKGRKEV